LVSEVVSVIKQQNRVELSCVCVYHYWRNSKSLSMLNLGLNNQFSNLLLSRWSIGQSTDSVTNTLV